MSDFRPAVHPFSGFGVIGVEAGHADIVRGRAVIICTVWSGPKGRFIAGGISGDEGPCSLRIAGEAV